MSRGRRGRDAGAGQGVATEVFCSVVADNVCPAIPEACLPGEGMVLQIDKIFWEPSKPPDRNPENSADRRRLLIVGQRCISLSNVVASLRQPTDGPSPET